MTHINLEDLGIKKSVVKKNKRYDESIDNNKIKSEVNTSVVSMYEAPDTSNAELMKDFSGLINKFGKIGTSVSADLNKQNTEDFLKKAQLDALNGEKKSEEDLRKDTNNKFFGDYNEYLKSYQKIASLNGSQKFSFNVIKEVNSPKYSAEEKTNLYKKKYNEEIKIIDDSFSNGDITAEEYSIIKKNFISERDRGEKLLSKYNTNRLSKEILNKEKIVINSKDSIEVKRKKLQELNYSSKKIEEVLSKSKHKKEIIDFTTVEIDRLNKEIDNDLSINGESDSEVYAIDKFDEFQDNIMKDAEQKNYSSEEYIYLNNKLNEERSKFKKKYEKIQDKYDTEQNIQNHIVDMNQDYDKKTFNVQDFYNSFVESDISNKDTIQKADKSVSILLNKSIEELDIDLIKQIKNTKSKNGKKLNDIYRSEIKKAEDKITSINNINNKVKSKEDYGLEEKVNLFKFKEDIIKISEKQDYNIVTFEKHLTEFADKNNLDKKKIYKKYFKIFKENYTESKINETISNGDNLDILLQEQNNNTDLIKSFNGDFAKKVIFNKRNELVDGYLKSYQKNPDKPDLKYLQAIVDLEGSYSGEFNNKVFKSTIDSALNGNKVSLKIIKDLEDNNINVEGLKDEELSLNNKLEIMNDINPNQEDKNLELIKNIDISAVNEQWDFFKKSDRVDFKEYRDKITSLKSEYKMDLLESKRFDNILKYYYTSKNGFKSESEITNIVTNMLYKEERILDYNDFNIIGGKMLLPKSINKEELTKSIDNFEDIFDVDAQLSLNRKSNGYFEFRLFDNDQELNNTPILKFKSVNELNNYIFKKKSENNKNNIKSQKIQADKDFEQKIKDGKIFRFDSKNKTYRIIYGDIVEESNKILNNTFSNYNRKQWAKEVQKAIKENDWRTLNKLKK